jgi:hypothetical protein
MSGSSGTFAYGSSGPTNAGIILDAFDRIQRPPPTIGRHEMLSARASLNDELIAWENKGYNYWKTISGTVALQPNQATYILQGVIPPLYFGSVTPSQLLAQGGGALPTTNPFVFNQLWNNSGLVSISPGPDPNAIGFWNNGGVLSFTNATYATGWPTSSAGLLPGAVWNNSLTVAVVPGLTPANQPSNLVTIEEVYYSTVNALGNGVNSDRWLVPMTRTEYAQITNKMQTGIPTRYWYQMLALPQITFWEVPAAGMASPQYVVNWFGLQQMQDANLGNGETPDVPRRALDALKAKMALRLCEKFGPQQPQARQMMMMEKKIIADEAWNDMQRRDQEPGIVMRYSPNVAVYGRMRR